MNLNFYSRCFGLTRPGIEIESTVPVADALSTRPPTATSNSFAYFRFFQDVIVHVRDESHPDRSNQLKNVLAILSNLKLKPQLMKNIVEVRNKIDVVNDR